MDIHSALQRFVSEYVSLHQAEQKPMVIQYDSNWPSPCYQSKANNDEWVAWQPVRQTSSMSLSDFERALDITMNQQLVDYFTCYWSENLNAQTPRGNLQLLFAWNEQDFDRLLQNMVAHVMMKRRLKQKDTLFFAVTDEDDFIISVDNQSGKVMLEQVGMEPQEELADSLLSFIEQLSPRL